ncbi:MAG: aspartate-semialdehyde dehydrogenase, partial [Acidobacteriota bacterium]|nr:aspartate-semialdehyde dehydrogenase [Acidobacteriota bacterium]
MGNRKRIQVGILGSTGMVGQQLIQELTDHPWFELTWLGASERSAGRQYTDVTDWRLPTALSSSLG